MRNINHFGMMILWKKIKFNQKFVKENALAAWCSGLLQPITYVNFL